MFSVVLALFGFLSTTAIVGAPLFIVIVLASFLVGRQYINKYLIFVAIFCIFASFLGILFATVNGGYYGDYASTGSSGLVFPLAILIGLLSIFVVNIKYLNTLLLLIAFEVIVGYLEYYLGVRSILGVEFKGEVEFGDVDYLNGNRVFGLGYNSSAFALKFLFGVVILCYLKLTKNLKYYHYICLFLFIAGFYVNFSRTSFLSFCFGLLIFIYLHSVRLLLLSLVSIILSYSILLGIFLYEFTRGSGQLDLSGRDFIFPIFVKFIAEHPWLGNFGYKYYMTVGDGVYHAHNSYLQVAATSGIPFLIAIIAFIFYLSKINLIVICIPLFMYSTFQYGIFWGMSLYDQILFFILFSQAFKVIGKNKFFKI